ncbi:MAG: prealbumin-like fold domain-containing protein [bacterium]|nr:prealbumin-like fold domain-containing protein [bacterium]
MKFRIKTFNFLFLFLSIFLINLKVNAEEISVLSASSYSQFDEGSVLKWIGKDENGKNCTSGENCTFGFINITGNRNTPLYCMDYYRHYPAEASLTEGGKTYIPGYNIYEVSMPFENEHIACVVKNYLKKNGSHDLSEENAKVYNGSLLDATGQFSAINNHQKIYDLQWYIWDTLKSHDSESGNVALDDYLNGLNCNEPITVKNNINVPSISLKMANTSFTYNSETNEYVSEPITVQRANLTGNYTIQLASVPDSESLYASTSANKAENESEKLITGSQTLATTLYLHYIPTKLETNAHAWIKVYQDNVVVESYTDYGVKCVVYNLVRPIPVGKSSYDYQRLISCDTTSSNRDVKNIVGASATVKIKEYMTKTVIKKTDATTGKELEGATLRILDKDKKEIPCTIRKSDGKEEDLDKCTWVSGKSSTTVVGLDAGDYYLEETIAPKGYVKSSKMVPFKVKADGSTTPVEMENKVEEVVVPDTLGKRSTLLLIVAMLDIALGIGVLIYVKRNRTQE